NHAVAEAAWQVEQAGRVGLQLAVGAQRGAIPGWAGGGAGAKQARKCGAGQRQREFATCTQLRSPRKMRSGARRPQGRYCRVAVVAMRIAALALWLFREAKSVASAGSVECQCRSRKVAERTFRRSKLLRLLEQAGKAVVRAICAHRHDSR